MATIEWPLARDAPDIIGRIVVIALDPIASVAALNDETATRRPDPAVPRACEECEHTRAQHLGESLMSCTQYLNFLWTEDGPRLTLDFSPCASGLPSPPYAWAAVPLAPAVPREECTRPPVSPDPPLPGRWTDCYLYTLHFTGGTVSRIHLGDAEQQGPRLGEEEQMDVFMAQYEDRRKIGLAHRARRAAEEAARVDEADTGPGDEAPAEVRRETERDPEIEDDAEHALMAELFAHDAVPRMTPHFEIWYDLSAFSPEELGDPAQIQSEIDRLEEIEWEWAQRTVMSKGPETNACQLDEIGEATATTVLT